MANQLRSGRPAKLSVDPKSIYRSTDAKNVVTNLSGEEVSPPTIIAKNEVSFDDRSQIAAFWN